MSTPQNPNPQTLLAALTLSWGKDTARGGDWLPTVPSYNQCVPTALVVQDYYGGQIWRAPTPGGDTHYWNAFCEHGTLDFSSAQCVYLHDLPQYNKGSERSRKTLLANEDVARRYLILSARVGVWLRWLCRDEARGGS